MIFTATGKALGMTQAAVSQRIHALERELGVALFDRRGGRVFLSDAGQRLYGHAQTILGLHRKARRNAESLKLQNVVFIHTDIGELPLEHQTVDVVITNGVFNLCPDKSGVLAEVFRVLRPGGRLQMADILLHGDVSSSVVATKGSWSD